MLFVNRYIIEKPPVLITSFAIFHEILVCSKRLGYVLLIF
jgi:hypothetical protein